MKRFSVQALFACGCATAAITATAAIGQTPSGPTANPASAGVGEIVVTAQRRSQNQQDVPISLTAVTSATLQANRITSVVDLGTAVPNLAARFVGGGAMLPAFTMRGVTSYGVVPGSDKEISIYIDGVYNGSTVGSAIDLPEVSQIEVLRGPQGTLFGRNATAGAISVTTRDPGNRFGIDQQFTAGNYDEFRSKTRVDTGRFGDFTASISFLHDERRGDIRNLGAGAVWSFPASAGVPTRLVSPKYLGNKNLNSVFAAIKYEPGDDVSIVNKFDWTGDHYTPVGSAAVGYYPEALGATGPTGADLTTGGYFAAILNSQTTPPLLDVSAKRPSSVNNSFSLPSYNRDWGDSLTARYAATDHLSFKNILAYRASYLRSADQLGGLGDLTITPATIAALAGTPYALPPSLIGSPFVAYGIEQVQKSKQFSDELQANYTSRYVTLTIGALYFHLKTQNGGTPGMPNNVALTPVPFFSVSNLGLPPSTAYNKATSLAAYVQAEGHITSKLDIVGGFRETNDKKSGTFVGASVVPFSYEKTKPSYLLGVNYKPTHDVLLYGKYSTAFVSGGAAGTIVFKPEGAKSWEIGVKSEFLNHRLRANLALYTVKYDHLQAASAGINVGHPELGLVNVDQGGVRAKGIEFESTIVPMRNLTFGIAGGYTDVKFTYINPFSGQGALGQAATVDNFFPTLQPKYNANLYGEYDTPPLFGDTQMTFRIDASWHDKQLTDGFLAYQQLPQYKSLMYSPSTWIVNGRVSLDHLKLPYVEGQIALWVKNLTNARQSVFPDIFGFVGSTEFQAARTFGLDVNFKY